MFIDSKEAFQLKARLEEELMNGNTWIAYNTIQTVYSVNDFFSFKAKEEAIQFCSNNVSDSDAFTALPISHVSEELIGAINAEKLSSRGQSIQILLELNNSFQNIEYNILNFSIMNQKNLDYLSDQVKFTGFGEGLENDLRDKIQKQTPEFQIAHKTRFGNDDVSSVLHFKKSDQTDMYFFNRYEVSLKPEQSKDEMVQTFYINKGNNITLKEAFNLMNGRAVNKDLTNKEDQVYNAWLQLDYKQTDTHGNYKLKQFHENYGYDLNAALQKHPIKELSNEQEKTRLEESLQKGNRQSVTFIQNGSERKHFIEANPQFKTINIYDSNMQRMSTKQGQDEKPGQGEQQSSKQSLKQNEGDDSDGMLKASKNRRKKQSNSNIN